MGKIMIFEECFSFENLLKAHQKCRRQKGHKNETVKFELNLGKNLADLQRELLNGTYRVGKYHQFTIYEPKKRIVEALPYRDRVVQMALCNNILEPYFEKKLIYDNCACRKGKGTSFAIKRLKRHYAEAYKSYGTNFYALKCDVKHFFASIDRKILLNHLLKCNFDSKTKWLLKIIINSCTPTDLGLPIGNQTSQWFALFYLDGLDKFIKRKLKCKLYVRYMDDFVILHSSKAFLRRAVQFIQMYLQQNLNISLNRKTELQRVCFAVPFLGHSFRLLASGKLEQTALRKNLSRAIIRLKMAHKVEGASKSYLDFLLLRQNCYS